MRQRPRTIFQIEIYYDGILKFVDQTVVLIELEHIEVATPGEVVIGGVGRGPSRRALTGALGDVAFPTYTVGDETLQLEPPVLRLGAVHVELHLPVVLTETEL